MINEKTTKTLEKLLDSADERVALEAANLLIFNDINQQKVNTEWAIRDRAIKLDEADRGNEANGKEIDRLAEFLVKEAGVTPKQGVGAVDTAIRLIKSTIDS